MAERPPRSDVAVATACFFLSGVAALLYEVVWVRLLAVSFGHTVYAVSAVLASYMGGLALGSVSAARWAGRVRRRLRAYGLLEAAIGLYCGLSPLLFLAVDPLYLRAYHALEPGPLQAGALQLLLSGALMLPPTALMGATLPILSRAVVESSLVAASRVGTLYAVNTWGAVVGTAATGFLLLPSIGLRNTIWVGVAVNLLVAAIALTRGRTVTVPPADDAGRHHAAARVQATEVEATPRPSRARITVALVAIGASGAASMAYEIAWTRALSLTLGSSTYSFTAMLTTFLAGLALGALAISRVLRRRVVGLAALGFAEIGIALAVVAVLPAFGRMPGLLLAVLARTGVSHAAVLGSGFALSFLVMIGPTLLIGATFPLLVSAVQRGPAGIGRDVGIAYGANTLGTILGAGLAGVVLVPLLGIRNTILAGVAANLAAGVTVVAVAPDAGRRGRLAAGAAALAVAVLGAALPRWDAQEMTTGAAVYADRLLREAGDGGPRSKDASRLLFYREGLSTTVAVKRSPVATTLSVNGKTDASNGFDMATQVLSGHLGPLLFPSARRALVIGLASGVTVGAVAQHPLERIDVAEIEPAMVEASRFFLAENRNALADPRVLVLAGDGRHILASAPQPYDVIVSEPSNPWIAGVASLFTREFYEAARRHLSERGVLVQWLGGYQISTRDMRMVARTLLEVFPHVSVWAASPNDFLLVATPETISLDLRAIRERLAASPGASEDFERYRWGGANLAYRFFLGEEDLRRFSLGAPINTDDRPLLEFSAPLALYGHSAIANAAAMRAFRREEWPRVDGLDPALLAGAAAHVRAAWEDWHAGHYDEAAHQLSRAGPAEALDRAVRVDRARVLFSLGRFGEAQAELASLSREDPPDAAVKRYLKAAQALQAPEVAAGLEETTRSGQALSIALGDALHELSRQRRDGDLAVLALEQYAAAAQVHPATYDLLNNYAGVQFETGDVDGAIRTLQRAIALDPENPGMHYNLGFLLESRGRADEAARAYADAVRLAPGWPMPAKRLAALRRDDPPRAR